LVLRCMPPNMLSEPLRWPRALVALRWLPASVLFRQHSDDLKTSESQRSATNARGQRSGSLSIFGGMHRKTKPLNATGILPANGVACGQYTMASQDNPAGGRDGNQPVGGT